jgi:hypothetical protein
MMNIMKIIDYYKQWLNKYRHSETKYFLKFRGRNILHKIKRGKANWIGYILRRNFLLKHLIEGKIEGTAGRERRRKQLLDDLTGKRRHWNLNEEALDPTLWALWEEATDLSQDRLRNDDHLFITCMRFHTRVINTLSIK